MSGLEFTGERFIPGTRGEIWIEHWHRYHFAMRWAHGKRVLDVACGEGYGSALLARTARQVTGIDVSQAAVDHAVGAYAEVANLSFKNGSCAQLPLADASVDLVVSFETIEHITAQEEFLDEIARVLAPGGVLLLSCPNKLEYSDRRGFANEFHVRELYRGELEALVAARLPAIAWYGQKPSFFSVIAPEAPAASAQLVEVEESDPAHAGTALSDPLYFLLAASREPQALDAVPRTLAVLSDRGEWVRRDYEKVMRWMQEGAVHRQQLEEKIREFEREREAQRVTLHERNDARPQGWREWLAWPFARLRRRSG
ncbi:MAG: class I SAM-dependent methyltransferase [Usitatibacter sp.]